MPKFWTKTSALIAVFFFSNYSWAEVQTPTLRLRFGYFMTTVTAGSLVKEEPLDSLVTLIPTVLWDMPTFRSRVGFHFLGELASSFGSFPISGIGMSGYFYPMGISSAHEVTPDNVVIQKYRPSPYVLGGVTPVNFTLNRDAKSTFEQKVNFSASMLEIMLGIGMDYPFRANLTLFGDVNYRFASLLEKESSGQTIKYTSIGLTLGMATSYF